MRDLPTGIEPRYDLVVTRPGAIPLSQEETRAANPIQL